MKFKELKELDQANIANTYARSNLAIKEGAGAICYSFEGKKYIDFVAGIAVNALGFCDEEWVSAVIEQTKTLQHASNLFYTEPNIRLATKLVDKTGHKKVFFGNSGAEANEGAIKIARKYSSDKYGANRYEIITLKNSFHGRTISGISATGQDNFHVHFNPLLGGFKYVDANDLQGLKAAISQQTCGIMVEMVQGEGGVMPLDVDFVKGIEEICKEHDILFIADEVQTGIGRTGTFLAYENFQVKPDIVTIAKGLGGGLPIGAVLIGDKCEFTLKPGDHGSTFGGNPIACAGALVILDRINDEFLKDVKEKASYMVDKIKEIPSVVNVTGMGMMIGIEIEGKTAKEAVASGIENGLLLLTAKDKIRLLPPLIISKEEIDEGLEILNRSINEN